MPTVTSKPPLPALNSAANTAPNTQSAVAADHDVIKRTVNRPDGVFKKISKKITSSPKSNTLEAYDGKKADLEKQSSIRVLTIASCAFLLFYLILSVQSVRVGEQDRKNNAQATLYAKLTTSRETIDDKIRDIMILADNSFALYNSPRQSLGFIQQSPNVHSALITNLNNEIVAGTQNSQELLKQVPTDLKDNQFIISSNILKDGTTYPVIIRQQNNIRLAIALKPKSLIGTTDRNTTLFGVNGRVIDSDKAFNGQTTSQGSGASNNPYGLSNNQFSALLGGRFKSPVKTEKNGQDIWVTSIKVPNWNICLLYTSPSPRDRG